MSDASAQVRYRDIVENVEQLPAFPAVVTRLVEVINSPDSSADDAAALIEMDPALTGKMLRIANSAFYGMSRSISSVSSAVVILGFNTIRTLVLSASLVGVFGKESGNPRFDLERFWLHSITCALCCRALVRPLLHTRMMDPESAFCAGLLHDVGKLVFNQFADNDYGRVCESATTGRVPLLDAERAILGSDHARLGRVIADKWGLPLDLEHCMVHHHAPNESEVARDLVTVVHIADWMAHGFDAAVMEGELLPQLGSHALQTLSLTEQQLEQVRESVRGNVGLSHEFLTIISG